MPDSAQERTEAPTSRRRSEARAGGQIAKSADLNAAVVLLTGLLFLHYWGQDLLGRLLSLMRQYLGEESADAALDPHHMGMALQAVLLEAARMVMPLMIGVVIFAAIINYLQVGWLITFKPFTPSVERLNPLSGLSRMFGARSFVHLLMGVCKMTLLALLAYWTLSRRIEALANAAALSHLSMVAVTIELVWTLGLRLAIALLILAIIDYVYQRYRTEKDLKMTKEEVKEEMKRMDGDPKIKARRRQIQLQLAMQRIRSAVPKADVVITNPTEFAVVLQYDAETMTAPKLTAKGTDYLAMKIRELAIEHGVPIVERPPLARAIYRTVEVGQEVPAQFYKAVAEVLSYVYELAGRGHKRRAMAGVSMN